MALLDEIQEMKAQGFTDQDVIAQLSQKGLSPKEISEAIAQAQIREAVSGGLQAPPAPGMQVPAPDRSYQQEIPQQQQYQEQQYDPYQGQQQGADQSGYQQYDQYQSAAVSTDAMGEIAEQVVLEKLSPLRQRLEEVIDLRSMIDAKILYLDDRLKRIESVLDQLQLSILQKVGSYVSNVEDIKNELQETQKTFKALVDSHKHK